MIEIRYLIAKLCIIAYNIKAVCKALRDKKLLEILGGKKLSVPLSVGL